MKVQGKEIKSTALILAQAVVNLVLEAIRSTLLLPSYLTIE